MKKEQKFQKTTAIASLVDTLVILFDLILHKDYYIGTKLNMIFSGGFYV